MKIKAYFKKGIFLGIIFLLLGTGATTGINIKIKNSETPCNVSMNTIYVDDNAVPPYDGSIDHPYKYIQNGINHSSDGDTVYVYNGIYFENVIVDKSINLIGEDKNFTIIDGVKKSNVINISEHVNISGFTIQNSGIGWFGVYIASGNNLIENCIITNNTIGIFLYSNNAVDNKIKKCFINNSKKGIFAYETDGDLRIELNIISNNFMGIIIQQYKDSNICNILDNTIENNLDYGLQLYNSASLVNVYGNTFRGNVEYGIYIKNSNLNQISNNNFIDNTKANVIFKDGINMWSGNYWSPRSIKLIPSNSKFPEIIFGTKNIQDLSTTPWINIDWNPSRVQLQIKP